MAHKYNARKTTIDGITFDSMAEARRYSELLLLERAGEIADLEMHPRFEIQPAFTLPSGEKFAAVRYEADFRYVDKRTGERIVEDVKGVETPVFKLKRKMMAHVHGISVQVVQA